MCYIFMHVLVNLTRSSATAEIARSVVVVVAVSADDYVTVRRPEEEKGG